MQSNLMLIFSGIALLSVAILQLCCDASVAWFLNIYSFLIYGGLWLLWRNMKSINVIVKTLPRDVRFLSRAATALYRVKKMEKKNKTLIDVFRENVDKNPNKICFYFEAEKWTFRDVDEFSNQVANTFQTAGYRKGDVVALLMGNSAAYVAMWIGLAKLGVITALINTNLKNEPLLHSIRSGKAKSIIYTPEFSASLTEIRNSLEGLQLYQFGGVLLDGADDFATMLKTASKEAPIPKDIPSYRDPLVYIYTSGTTGLPKAAIITNVKVLMMAFATWHVLAIKENDIMYNTLPLYHSAGGLVGISSTLAFGFPTVIRRKFSASQYWTDCINYKCTVGMYIGEMCRYILAQPPRPEDTQHRMRMLIGNGMRPVVWKEFVERFNIARICELYGSTEGNTNMINIDKTIGAVGFLPNILPKRFLPMDLIRVDDNGQPIRGQNGLCIRCKANEPGSFVGVISTSNSSQEFAGYVGGEKENKKKVLENVFRHGDQVFWSGDLLVKDKLGYIYFKDRLGDTFRWKGENVSTAEVESLLSKATGNLDVTVYGVEIGNLEGRAGMATIVDPIGQLNLKELTAEIDKCLPTYARPLFIRIAQQVDLTGTFKLKKTDLQRDGFDPKIINDTLFFRNASEFVPLTQEIYNDLINGRIRV